MAASLLVLPDDPRREIVLWIQYAVAEWPQFVDTHSRGLMPHPRSEWLRWVEDELRRLFPASSSADRKLTARHYAPFPLAAGHDVP